MPTDILALSAADARSILIGFVTAGLLWLLGLAFRVTGVAGLKGLLHIRRSMARGDLAFIEKVGTEPTALLAAIMMISAMFAASMVSLLVVAGLVALALSVFEIQTPLLMKGFLLGSASGGVVSLAWTHAWHTWLLASAIINRDGALARLRISAGLSA